jgi:hypothetical protein
MSDLILPLVVIGTLAVLAVVLECAERSLKAKMARQRENPRGNHTMPRFNAKRRVPSRPPSRH